MAQLDETYAGHGAHSSSKKDGKATVGACTKQDALVGTLRCAPVSCQTWEVFLSAAGDGSIKSALRLFRSLAKSLEVRIQERQDMTDLCSRSSFGKRVWCCQLVGFVNLLHP